MRSRTPPSSRRTALAAGTAAAAAAGAGWMLWREDDATAPRPPAPPRPPADRAAATPAPDLPAFASGQVASPTPPGAVAWVQPATPTMQPPLPEPTVTQSPVAMLRRNVRGNRLLQPDETAPPALGGDPMQQRVTLPEGRGSAQLAGAAVTAQDLGLPAYPNARVDVARSMLVDDVVAGSMRSITLVSSDPFERLAAYYREQLRAAGTLQESAAGPEQLALEAVTPADGVRRSVMIWRNGSEVRVTLIRAAPPAGRGR